MGQDKDVKKKGGNPGRGSRGELSVERVVGLAAKHIEAHGLSRFSMHQLAAELEVTTTAIYHHFKNKDQLLIMTAVHILKSVPIPDLGLGWKQRVKRLILDYQALMLSYPGLALFLVKNRESEAAMIWTETLCKILLEANFDGETAAHALAALSCYINPLTYLDEKSAEGSNVMLRQDRIDSLLSEQREQIPSLLVLLPYLSNFTYDAHYETGLERVIAGIDAELSAGKKSSKH